MLDNTDILDILDKKNNSLSASTSLSGKTHSIDYSIIANLAAQKNAQNTHISTEPNDVIPSDPYFSQQWHLRNTGQNGGTAGIDLNVTDVWETYKGADITVAVVDDGVDFSHGDLSANYDQTMDWDTVNNDGNASPENSYGDRHGTAVAGVIAGDDNGSGMVGVAPDATVAGLRIGFGQHGTLQQVNDATARFDDFDVVNNSWGYVDAYADNFNQSWFQTVENNIMHAVSTGRGGLGTNIIFSAGNDRAEGDNVNYHNMINSPYTIAVGAITRTGDYSGFSTPGASVLVAAPGSSIVTSDNTGSSGYNSGDYVSINGTSFSAPAVAGVVALMLDANEDLGYRDVQEILAYTSRQVDSDFSDWVYNGSNTWNGGGLHFSHQYGFGLPDAEAAVELAESWHLQNTYSNIETASGANNGTVAIPDGNSVAATSTINIANNIQIDQVEVTVSISHTYRGQLDVYLVSPGGTVSHLVDNEGAAPGSNNGTTADHINFTFSSVAHWGEYSAGTWSLVAYDRVSGTAGQLNSWSLNILGDNTNDDVHIITDEFASVSTSTHTNLTDTNGGTDTINLAAVSDAVTLDLSGTFTSNIAGRSFTAQNASSIENIIAGDHNDLLYGSNMANTIYGRGGNDNLNGHGGNDVLNGGIGDDTMDGGLGDDELIGGAGSNSLFGSSGHDSVSFQDNSITGGATVNLATGVATAAAIGGTSTNSLNSIEGVVGSNFNDSITGDSGDNTLNGKAGFDTIHGGEGNDTLIGGGSANSLYGGNGYDTVSFDDEIYTGGATIDLHYQTASATTAAGAATNLLFSIEYATGSRFADNISGTMQDDILSGLDGNDTISAAHGNDTIYGGGGDDTIFTGRGTDTVHAGEGDDIINDGRVNDWGIKTIYGDGGNDRIYGSISIDNLYGGEGQDIIYGYGGGNLIRGGGGNDTLYAGDDADRVYGDEGDDTIHGGALADSLYGGDGIDTINGGGGNDVIYGDGGNDIIDGQAGNDTIYGGEGDDQITSTDDGLDVVWGGNGNDTFTATGTNNSKYFYGEGGNDRFNGGNSADIARGGTGQDILYGYGGMDTLIGQADNDTLYGGEGRDSLYGDEGDDILYGEGGDDYLYGGIGNDTMYGGDGINQFWGGDGVDTMYGGNSNDVLHGENGADIIETGDGIDLVYGGAGNDRINENAQNTSGGKYLYGNEGDDLIYGGSGQDIFYGGDDNDTLYGQGGIDTLYGEAGDDTIHGGADNDTLYGGIGQDTLYGDTGTDQLFGNNGNDTLNGGDARDFLWGGDGSDTLRGDDGHDLLYGEAGNDTLIGGTGFDTLTGGAGRDTFVLQVDGSGGFDFIQDFSYGGEADYLDVSDILTGYDSVTDDINNFVIKYSVDDFTGFVVSHDGVYENFTKVANVYGDDLSGYSVEDLIDSGHLIV